MYGAVKAGLAQKDDSKMKSVNKKESDVKFMDPVKKLDRKMNVFRRTNKIDGKKIKGLEFNILDIPIPVVKQIENSERELCSYTEEGSQLVTNVIIANDNRENNRRCTDKSERNDRLRAVEEESEIASQKFTEISGQWPMILKKNDALEIHEHSELQKKRGLDLIEQKNQMIEILKRDLAESDSRFLDEQAAQREDVRILQERIENQVKFIRKQYKNHIQCIKSTIDKQREYKIDKANKNWENLYNETMLVESNSLDARLAMIEKKENNIMKQYEMNEEVIRNLKSNMNAELHTIQREFELIKLKCIDNVEKLNYNYQVLKRREEENASAKAAQRRKINKLQDILSTKRKIFRETKTEFNAKVNVLQDEIEKHKRDIDRHDKKADRLAEIQEKTFKELWEFSQEQIDNRLEKIFKIDEIIHKTQLSIDWEPPRQLKYLDVSELPSFKRKPNTPQAENLRGVEIEQNAVDSYQDNRKRALMQLVFDATVKNCRFVLDDELIEIAKSHPKHALTLLYNAMSAYGLHTVDAWQCLLSCVQSAANCAVCRGPVVWSKSDSDRPTKADSEWKTESENKLIDGLLSFTENHSKYIEKTLATNVNILEKALFEQKTTDLVDAHDAYQSFERDANTADSDNSTITFSLSLTDFEQLCSDNDSNPAVKSQHSFSQVELEQFQMESAEEQNYGTETSMTSYQNVDEEKEYTVPAQLCDNADHPLTIKDTDYLLAVKKSIDNSKSKALDQLGKNNSEFYLTNTLSTKDISDYWKQYLYAFPEDRLKLWDVFDKAIKKYYQTLHMRFKKAREVEKLEMENMEMKKILNQFMDADQDDIRLQNICTPKIRKQQVNSTKNNMRRTLIKEDSTNVRGTSVHIFTVERTYKKKMYRPFTAPTL